MKLISEQIEEVNFISESIDGKKNYFIETFKVNRDGTKQEKVSTFDPNDETCKKGSKNTPDKKAVKLTGFGFANENL